MKKISTYALLTLVVLPGFMANNAIAALAEESLGTSAPVATPETSELAAEQIPTSDASAATVTESVTTAPVAAPHVEYENTSNPEIAFPRGLQLGVGVSATSGLNGFIGYENKKFDSFWAKRFGIRFDFATSRPLRSPINSMLDSVIGDDGVDIGDNLTVKDIKLKAQHLGAMLDFYPFGDTWFLGGWRITGGYYVGKINAQANLTGSLDGVPDSDFAFELAGHKYRYLGNEINGTARADWKYRGPYVGAGFDFGLFAGIKIYLDAGIVFADKAAQLSLDVPTDNLQQYNKATNTWTAVNVSELDQAKADTLKDAQDELDKLKYYPIVKLGLMYRF